MSNALQPQQTFSLTPRTMDEAMKMAEMMADSEMVPNDYKKKPGNVLIAVQMGLELGLKPVQSLQNIAVVNGRPALWGDGLRALVMSAPDLVSVSDTLDESTMTARCVITRNINGTAVAFIGEFSKTDAEGAGLWGRNTWKNYPKKMLEWRAFGFAARKAYADRLKGIQLAEEVQDIPTEAPAYQSKPKDMGPAEVELPDYKNEQLEANKQVWLNAIESGKTTPDALIATISTKYKLSDTQQETIRGLA